MELCGDAAACEDRRVFLYSRGLKRLPARLLLTGSPRRTPPSLLTRMPLCLNPGAASIIHAASGAARHLPRADMCLARWSRLIGRRTREDEREGVTEKEQPAGRGEPGEKRGSVTVLWCRRWRSNTAEFGSIAVSSQALNILDSKEASFIYYLSSSPSSPSFSSSVWEDDHSLPAAGLPV